MCKSGKIALGFELHSQARAILTPACNFSPNCTEKRLISCYNNLQYSDTNNHKNDKYYTREYHMHIREYRVRHKIILQGD